MKNLLDNPNLIQIKYETLHINLIHAAYKEFYGPLVVTCSIVAVDSAQLRLCLK